jgi:hypothetical protein
VPTKKEKQPLSVTHPELAKEADGWDPSSVTHGSNRKLKWLCKNEHRWEAVVANRADKNSNCPFCAGQRVLIGVNDLASRFPDLALEAHDWDPTTEAYGTAHKKSWVCKLGHIWNATVLSRTQGNGCPYCANNKVLPGFNDLLTKYPEIAAEADGWDPSSLLPYSNKKMKWKCTLGHIWFAQLSNRANGTSCPVCSNKVIVPGFNDLATTNPGLALEANGWDATKFSAGSGRIFSWKCKYGHEWKSVIRKRIQDHCPICSGRKLLSGFNDLATQIPALASQAFGWDPSKVTKGSHLKRKWKCNEGHIWSAVISSRAFGRGCPSCSLSGYDPNAESWIYFLRHEDWNLLQIGITNVPKGRIHKHTMSGWEVIEIRGPMDGLIAREWETSILKMLNGSGAHLAPEDVAGKFDGYTEAWRRDSFPVKSIKELMRLTEEFENKKVRSVQ